MKKNYLCAFFILVGTMTVHTAAPATVYNNSALTIFDAIGHVEAALIDFTYPLDSRQTNCGWQDKECRIFKQTLIIEGKTFGGIAHFTSDKNTGFDATRMGLGTGIKGYINPNLTVGGRFTRSLTDTRDDRTYSNVATNSLTAFAEYLAANDFFVNTGVGVGHAKWSGDRIVNGLVYNPLNYDTEIFTAQATTGTTLKYKSLFATPHAGVRYLYVYSEKHDDAAGQQFDRWSNGMLTGMAGVRLGAEFIRYDFTIRPGLFAAAGYDAISNGADTIRTDLNDGTYYYTPIDIPPPFAFNTGAGISVTGSSFVLNFDYRLDSRNNFLSHTLMLNFKVGF